MKTSITDQRLRNSRHRFKVKASHKYQVNNQHCQKLLLIDMAVGSSRPQLSHVITDSPLSSSLQVFFLILSTRAEESNLGQNIAN